MKTTIHLVLLAMITLLLGCQTSYRAKSIIDGLGYQDEKVQDGIFHIKYNVNAHTPATKALEFWHQRAEELCGNKQYFADTRLGKNSKLTISKRTYYREYFNSSDTLHTFNSDPKTYTTISRGGGNFPKASGFAYCEGKPDKLMAHNEEKRSCIAMRKLERKLKRNLRNIDLSSLESQCKKVTTPESMERIIQPKQINLEGNA
ncbi:hypothetical protein [Paraglaciecola sp.]|uniref:hypothetical protein n=1 Tax=Paraglaciecola sp. TaxID=1920173 RepID=UPI003EF18280